MNPATPTGVFTNGWPPQANSANSPAEPLIMPCSTHGPHTEFARVRDQSNR